MEIFNTSGLGSITPSNNREQQEVGFKDFLMHSLEDLDNDEAFNKVKQAVLVEFQADIKLLEETKQKVTNSSFSTEKKDNYLAKLTDLLTQLQSLQNESMKFAEGQFRQLKNTFFNQMMGQMKLPKNMLANKQPLADFNQDKQAETKGLSSSEISPHLSSQTKSIANMFQNSPSMLLLGPPNTSISMADQQADMATLNKVKNQTKQDVADLLKMINDSDIAPII